MKNIIHKIVLLLSFTAMVIMEIKGFDLTFKSLGFGVFIYYTEISNLILLISALASLVYMIINIKKDLKFPYWLTALRYLSTVMLLMTMLITIFVLVPHSPHLKNILLFEGYGLYHHTIIPILTIVSYLFIEPHQNKKSLLLIPVIATLIYGFVMVFLNILGKVVGPYFFLNVKNQPVMQSVIWLSSLLVLVFLFALLIWGVAKLVQKLIYR